MDKESQFRPGMVEELRRRKVLRSTTLYAVVGWCILQWDELAISRFGFPEWSISLLLTMVVLGFPVVVALSWVFDVTPAGFKRTDSDELPVPRATLASRVLTTLVGLLLAVTVIMLSMR